MTTTQSVGVDSIVEVSFEGYKPSETKAARAHHDYSYKVVAVNEDIGTVLAHAHSLGYAPEMMVQIMHAGRNAHLRLTKQGLTGFARITTETTLEHNPLGGSDETGSLRYKLYVPLTHMGRS